MWSTPAMRPLAIDGAAPRTTTNMIALSVSLNSRMASGNQAIDGIVCRPVISEPTAGPQDAGPGRRPGRSTTPIDQRQREARHGALQRDVDGVPELGRVPCRSTARSKTVNGAGRTYSRLPAAQTTSCQTSRRRCAMAQQLRPGRGPDPGPSDACGARVDESRARRGRRAPALAFPQLVAQRRPWRRTSSRRRSVTSAARADDLGGLDAPGPVDVDRELGRRPGRAGW